MRFNVAVSYQALKLKCDVKGLGSVALLPAFKVWVAYGFSAHFYHSDPVSVSKLSFLSKALMCTVELCAFSVAYRR